MTTSFSYPVTGSYNVDRELHHNGKYLRQPNNINTHIYECLDGVRRGYGDSTTSWLNRNTNPNSHASSVNGVSARVHFNNYQCPQEYCKPVKPYFNVTWQEGNTSYYPITEGYFNLNPEAFGLSYEIFSEEIIVEKIAGYEVTITTGNWASQTSLSELTISTTATILPKSSSIEKPKRRFTSKKQVKGLSLHKRDTVTQTIPAACFEVCNNANLEAQSRGKVASLCASGSAFNNYREGCNNCIEKNEDQTKLSGRQYFNNSSIYQLPLHTYRQLLSLKLVLDFRVGLCVITHFRFSVCDFSLRNTNVRYLVSLELFRNFGQLRTVGKHRAFGNGVCLRQLSPVSLKL
ncbi:putative glycoprotein x [Diaporthe ampelina]|uniref:Putative glycoprotein x n=1 Tax=Diaporthe ampelina TaxID=1214573 RepID=A0A0G2H851_9PEZI|nr:putative glycoprotein x [Diaporthe ampelina]